MLGFALARIDRLDLDSSPDCADATLVTSARATTAARSTPRPRVLKARLAAWVPVFLFGLILVSSFLKLDS
jgi:hypothetical protein